MKTLKPLQEIILIHPQKRKETNKKEQAKKMKGVMWEQNWRLFTIQYAILQIMQREQSGNLCCWYG